MKLEDIARDLEKIADGAAYPYLTARDLRDYAKILRAQAQPQPETSSSVASAKIFERIVEIAAAPTLSDTNPAEPWQRLVKIGALAARLAGKLETEEEA